MVMGGEVLLGVMLILAAQFSQSSHQFSLSSPQSIHVNAVAVDEEMVYWYWREGFVTEPAITALDLTTGTVVWSKPTTLVSWSDLKVQGEWLYYRSTAPRRAALAGPSPESFHLVNRRTGEEQTIKVGAGARFLLPVVSGDCCLTSQGAVVRCSDAAKIGDLGDGEHHALAAGGKLYVLTNILDESQTYFSKRFLRKFDFQTMTLAAELELPVKEFWHLVAVSQDIMVFESASAETGSQLVCVDLTGQGEVARITPPRSVMWHPHEWRDDGTLVFFQGLQGMLRPVIVDPRAGSIVPDFGWQDPRLLLAWHQRSLSYPDFVLSNSRYIVGVWRAVELLCVDATTGEFQWSQPRPEDISQVAISGNGLGDHFVTVVSDGLEIINVATGACRTIRASDVGLTMIPQARPMPAEVDPEEAAASVLAGNARYDAMLEWGLYLIPVALLLVWIVVKLMHRRRVFNA